MVEDGLRVLKEMEDTAVKPSNFTLSVLVKMMSRSRRVDQAFELVTWRSEPVKVNMFFHISCLFPKA